MTGGLHDVIWGFYYLSVRGQDLHILIIDLSSFTSSYLEKQVIEMRNYLLMSSEERWEGRNGDNSCIHKGFCLLAALVSFLACVKSLQTWCLPLSQQHALRLHCFFHTEETSMQVKRNIARLSLEYLFHR